MATAPVIRSEAQRLFFQKIADGEPHPSLSREDAAAALAAHGGERLPLRAPGVVKANIDRGARVSAQRIAARVRGRG